MADDRVYLSLFPWKLHPPYVHDWETFLLQVRQTIVRQMSTRTDEGIAAKLRWLLKEWDETVTYYQSLGMLRTPLGNRANTGGVHGSKVARSAALLNRVDDCSRQRIAARIPAGSGCSAPSSPRSVVRHLALWISLFASNSVAV